MSIEQIADLDDPRIAVYRSLKVSNLTRGLPHFIVEGEKLLRRLLSSRFPVRSILMTDRQHDRLDLVIPTGVPVFVVPFELVHTLVGFPFHRGVVACGGRIPWPSTEELLAGAGKRSTLVICPRISNPENLGAIIRIGDVLGVDAILAGPTCPDPLSRRVLRVSMGSALRLPVLVLDQPEPALSELLVANRFGLWAAVAEPAAVSFEDVTRPERLALVLGDEDQGVPTDWLEACHQHVTIPMRPGASSLNVSVAAGILLYQLTRPDPA